MSDYHLAKRRFVEGVWEGIVIRQRADAPPPEIEVTHLGQAVPGVTLTDDPASGHWNLRIPVPVDSLGDGVQVFMVADAAAGSVLGSFTMIAGEVMGDDIRAEVQLLREELDMLKRAFRRHCLESR